MRVANSSIDSCPGVRGNGGGISITNTFSTPGLQPVQLLGVTVSGCKGFGGGGIYIRSTTTYIADSTFANNSAADENGSGAGGGVFGACVLTGAAGRVRARTRAAQSAHAAGRAGQAPRAACFAPAAHENVRITNGHARPNLLASQRPCAGSR